MIKITEDILLWSATEDYLLISSSAKRFLRTQRTFTVSQRHKMAKDTRCHKGYHGIRPLTVSIEVLAVFYDAPYRSAISWHTAIRSKRREIATRWHIQSVAYEVPLSAHTPLKKMQECHKTGTAAQSHTLPKSAIESCIRALSAEVVCEHHCF